MVVRNRRKLTKDRAKALVAAGLQRAATTHGIDQVAAEAACSRRCIEKALAHDTLPEAHTLFNAHGIDGAVLDELAAAAGFCMVPLEVEFEADLEVIAELSALLTDWLEALKDKKRDHRETQRIATRIRHLLPKLRFVVGEADRLHAVNQ